MYVKTEPYVKNNRLLINLKFLINETIGVILVCGRGNSRTIYIESIIHIESNEKNLTASMER
ncbi:hypothetical protein [Legionella sp.]|uniref:hypothetical protein n=1 Tax=Legionella sp. TaxID=459 RepID=UPI003C9ACFEB